MCIRDRSDNFYDLGQGLLNFFIWLVISLPYILLLAVIGLIVWFVLHISTRRHRKKMEARRENMQHQQPMAPQGQARGGRQPQPVPPKGTGAPQKPLVQPQEQEPDFTPEAVIPNKTDKEKENDGESKL